MEKSLKEDATVLSQPKQFKVSSLCNGEQLMGLRSRQLYDWIRKITLAAAYEEISIKLKETLDVDTKIFSVDLITVHFNSIVLKRER